MSWPWSAGKDVGPSDPSLEFAVDWLGPTSLGCADRGEVVMGFDAAVALVGGWECPDAHLMGFEIVLVRASRCAD